MAKPFVYVLILSNPATEEAVALRIPTQRRCHSVVTVLKSSQHYQTYKNWELQTWALQENKPSGKILEGKTLQLLATV